MSLILLALLPVVAHASVYMWVDADGNTHFGDQPPAEVAPKKVKVAPPPVSNDASAKERQQRMQDFLSEQQKDREARQVDQAKAAEQAAKKADLCTRMRAQLKNMARISTFYGLDENGDRVYATEEENERLRKDFRDKVKQACG
ncbi:DUF4124 domain-containing protein [Marinobacter sediminum]|uniref:DUF4124 domain-containing protein n=1 Tax=Marinobacter sediminum TaxID=256323 RepID=UPI0023B1C1A5|nr:DUF4124 domain-containing protein [Marinobacter sediminum]